MRAHPQCPFISEQMPFLIAEVFSFLCVAHNSLFSVFQNGTQWISQKKKKMPVVSNLHCSSVSLKAPVYNTML